MWQENLERQLSQFTNVCVLASFGKDSLLLLYSLSRMNVNLPVVWFGEKLSKQAERVIQELSLTVYSWPPVDRYLIPNGSGLSLVSEYMVGNRRMPSITDIEESEHGLSLAEAEKLADSPLQSAAFPYPWSVTLWGYRKSDRHPLLERTFAKEVLFGSTVLLAPLYELSDAEVFAALDDLGVEYDPKFTDDVSVSPEVFAALESMDWDKEFALFTFRQRFGLSC